MADAYIAAHEPSWRNAKHRQQWRNTLDTYAGPVLGKLPVAQVDVGAVMRVLEPLWREKTETASRLRGRIESFWTTPRRAAGAAATTPPAGAGIWTTSCRPASKIAKVEHHAALPWREIGAFMAALAQEEGVSALALRFAILTAARTGEVIGARWSEIDMQAAVWTVPAGRMKAAREHRVPLSDGALDVLREVAKLRTKPERRSLRVPRRQGRQAAVQHGAADAAAADGARRSDRAWLPQHVPRLVRRGDQLSARGSGGGAGAHAARQDRGGLSAWRPDGEAAAADGGLGCVLCPAGGDRRGGAFAGRSVTYTAHFPTSPNRLSTYYWTLAGLGWPPNARTSALGCPAGFSRGARRRLGSPDDFSYNRISMEDASQWVAFQQLAIG